MDWSQLYGSPDLVMLIRLGWKPLKALALELEQGGRKCQSYHGISTVRFGL